MYIFKVKGKAKIPDYVQLRDNSFSLLGYFRADRPEKGLTECGYGERLDEMKALIDEMPFGRMIKLEDK
jgi:hypothetical protein